MGASPSRSSLASFAAADQPFTEQAECENNRVSQHGASKQPLARWHPGSGPPARGKFTTRTVHSTLQDTAHAVPVHARSTHNSRPVSGSLLRRHRRLTAILAHWPALHASRLLPALVNFTARQALAAVQLTPSCSQTLRSEAP
jgi:hypothetical protein